MSQVWLLIIDPKNDKKGVEALTERLYATSEQRFLKQEGDGLEIPNFEKIARKTCGGAKVEEGDFVYLCIKPSLLIPSSPPDKDAVNIGGGIYARLVKTGNSAVFFTFKERYIHKPMYKTYLSSLPLIPFLEEEDFSEGLHLLGKK